MKSMPRPSHSNFQSWNSLLGVPNIANCLQKEYFSNLLQSKGPIQDLTTWGDVLGIGLPSHELKVAMKPPKSPKIWQIGNFRV